MLTYTRPFSFWKRPFLSLLALLLLGAGQANAVNYTWNGTVSTDWNTAANWTPPTGSPAGVPAAADQAIINNCTTCPVLTGNQSIQRLAINSGGKLDIGGFTMTATVLYSWGGTITSQAGTLQVVHVEDIRFCQFLGGKITINIGPNGTGVIHGGNTYNGPVECRWTNTGGATMASFIMSNSFPDTYKSDAVFINDSFGRLNIGFTGATFEGEVDLYNQFRANTQVGSRGATVFHKAFRIHNSAAGWVAVAKEATAVATFKGPVTVNNTLSAYDIGHFTEFVNAGKATFEGPVTVRHSNTWAHGGVFFTNSTFTPTASLQQAPVDGSTNASRESFTGGKLVFNNVDFQYAQPTVLSLSGAATHVHLAGGTRFAGPLNVKANHVLLNGVTCLKDALIEKYGGTNYSWGTPNNAGNNIFHGTTRLVNSGGQPWFFGQSAPDQFLGPLTVTHTGGNGTYLAHWSAGHVFKGNLSLILTAGSSGTIQLGGVASGGTSRLEEGRTIAGSFSSGHLKLFNFTQAGAIPQHITLSGSAGLTLGAGSRFESLLTATAGSVYLDGATFLSPLRLTKLAAGNDISAGGNKFYGKVNLVNQAGTGAINLATQAIDEMLPAPAPPLN